MVAITSLERVKGAGRALGLELGMLIAQVLLAAADKISPGAVSPMLALFWQLPSNGKKAAEHRKHVVVLLPIVQLRQFSGQTTQRFC